MKKPSGKKETRTLNVEIAADVRRRLKVYVADKELVLKAVVNEALDEYLKKRGA